MAQMRSSATWGGRSWCRFPRSRSTLIFRETRAGAFMVELERPEDARGFFARTWCARSPRRAGSIPDIAQCSISFNRGRARCAGMHYQAAAPRGDQLVRCTGADPRRDRRPPARSRRPSCDTWRWS